MEEPLTIEGIVEVENARTRIGGILRLIVSLHDKVKKKIEPAQAQPVNSKQLSLDMLLRPVISLGLIHWPVLNNTA